VKNDLERICGRVREFISSIQELHGSVAMGPAFEEIAREIFAFQYRENTPYRKWCEALGKHPGNVAGADEIPAAPAAAFKEFELTVLGPEARTRVFHSSGTTEQRPSRHFHNAATLEVYETSLAAGFRARVIPDGVGCDFLILTPKPEAAPQSSLVHMFETVSREFGARAPVFAGEKDAEGGWVVDFAKARRAVLESAKNGPPLVICGTAFSFVHWCDELRARGETLRLPQGSRVFETGGYKGRSRTVPKAELHRMIKHSLEILEPWIISEYGMSELSSQAYDRTAGGAGERIFRFPPWARARVISPETGREAAEGETGLLRVIDLANVGSVMAMQTEDLAVRRQGGFELAGRAALAEPRGCSLLPA